MKKFIGWLLTFLGFVFITAGLTVPLLGIMTAVATTGPVWLNTVYGNPDLGLGVTAVAVALVVLIGSIINAHIGKAGFFLAPVFGLAAYGVMLCFANWGAYQPGLPILGAINITSITNSTLLYIAGGAVALGMILGGIGHGIRRKTHAVKDKARRKNEMAAHDAYVPTSRDTDLAIASSRTPKIERYVRDPWGNLIKEEEYNDKIRSARESRDRK